MAPGPFFTLVVGVVFILQGFPMARPEQSGFERMVTDLLSGYDPDEAPPSDYGEVDVQVRLNLVKVVDIDRDADEMEVVASLNVEWNDERLQWNPDDYDGVHSSMSTVLPASRVWTPGVTLLNAVKTPELISPDRVHIYSNGKVVYIPLMRMRFGCDLDEGAFTNDGAKCRLRFGPSDENSDHVTLDAPDTGAITIDGYEAHPTFDLITSQAEVSVSVSFNLFFRYRFPSSYMESNGLTPADLNPRGTSTRHRPQPTSRRRMSHSRGHWRHGK